jgi:hypothetical protein
VHDLVAASVAVRPEAVDRVTGPLAHGHVEHGAPVERSSPIQGEDDEASHPRGPFL